MIAARQSETGMTPSRVNAIKLVRKIGGRLAREHPEIADDYRKKGSSMQRYIDIARVYLGPVESDTFPEVCSKAVGYAVRKLMPPEEQKKLTKQHRTAHICGLVDEMFGGFDTPEWSEHCRHAQSQKGPVERSQLDAMIMARGQTPWSRLEMSCLLRLSNDPGYQYESGQWEGCPYYPKIAAELNRVFHNGQEIRNAKTVGSYKRDLARRARKAGLIE
jgi:hypothetical protein